MRTAASPPRHLGALPHSARGSGGGRGVLDAAAAAPAGGMGQGSQVARRAGGGSHGAGRSSLGYGGDGFRPSAKQREAGYPEQRSGVESIRRPPPGPASNEWTPVPGSGSYSTTKQLSSRT